MDRIHKVAVFCGSSTGINPLYEKACLELAGLLNQHQINLVYGGGNIGLMGILADKMLSLGSEVTGVIPQKLVDIEVVHNGLTNLHIVTTLHERKVLMMELSDAFIIMPGGIGTLDELFEVITWRQLGYHNKTIGVLNISGFFDQLISLLGHLIDEGFLKRSHIEALIISDSPSELMMRIL